MHAMQIALWVAWSASMATLLYALMRQELRSG